LFSYLQSRIRGTASTGRARRRPGLIAFYWRFARRTKGRYALRFATSLAVALIDAVIPVFIGKPQAERLWLYHRDDPTIAGFSYLCVR